MGKKIEATCPVCKTVRTIQRKNQYGSTTVLCRPCALQQFKTVNSKDK